MAAGDGQSKALSASVHTQECDTDMQVDHLLWWIKLLKNKEACLRGFTGSLSEPLWQKLLFYFPQQEKVVETRTEGFVKKYSEESKSHYVQPNSCQ